MREFEFIDWIRRQAAFDRRVVPVGPGDDCAVVNFGNEKLLITSDQVLDGVHLDVAEDGPEAAGRKAAARNLSDIAAMAGVPVAMVATLAAPVGFTLEDGQALYRGLCAAGMEFGCPLVGGDLAAWKDKAQKLQVSVTVFGRCDGVGPVLRSGSKCGDAICVTGRLGGAWSSKRDLSFTPRIIEARLLATSFPVHAMIDISDGLAADLAHLLAASAVGAELEAAAIPIHPDAAGRDDPLSAALHDGEDYELLFALPADAAEKLVTSGPLPIPVTRIGTIVKGSKLALIRPDGRRETLEPTGWEHET